MDPHGPSSRYTTNDFMSAVSALQASLTAFFKLVATEQEGVEEAGLTGLTSLGRMTPAREQRAKDLVESDLREPLARKLPALQILHEVRVMAPQGRGPSAVEGPALEFHGAYFPAPTVAFIAAKAAGADEPWSRKQVALKLDTYQRTGLVKLDEQCMIRYFDLVVVIHAFAWLSNRALASDWQAAVCRDALRSFWDSYEQARAAWLAPSEESSDEVVAVESPLTPTPAEQQLNLDRVEIVGSEGLVLPAVKLPAARVPLPELPRDLDPCAEVSIDVDLSNIDWNVRPQHYVRDGKLHLCGKPEVMDAEYGVDVPERPLPPTVGRVVIKSTSSLKALRVTRHYRLIDLPVADDVVFYNRNSAANAVAAFRHRICKVTSTFQPSVEQLKALQLCADALARFLGPAGPSYSGQLARVRDWLASRTYPLARRQTMIKSLEKEGFVVDGRLQPSAILKASFIEAFIKNEPYRADSCKPPRMICARDDASKMLLGPLFQPLNDALFTSKFSVKHLSDAERPQALTERIGPGQVLVLDYTAYESSQRLDLQRQCEMRVYQTCCSTEENQKFVLECLRGLQRRATVKWNRGEVAYQGPPLRFSGEVTTSLGNTLNNIICILVARECANYSCHVEGSVPLAEVDWASVVASAPLVCEGDDSIQAIPAGIDATQWCASLCQTLTRFGLDVKPEVHSHVSESAFCGLMWNQHNMHRYSRDPLLALAKLCWASSDLEADDRLAMKAQALMVQCPHQPLVVGLAHFLRKEGKARGVQLDQYDVERYGVMGMQVLPTRGVSYQVTLTKGKLVLPAPEDYAFWAERWGVPASRLRSVDEAAAAGKLDDLETILNELKVNHE